MQIIWRALITYLDNTLRSGKSVNVKKFGAFAFDIVTELPKISQRQIRADSDMNTEREERKHIHKLRYLNFWQPKCIRTLRKADFFVFYDLLDLASWSTPSSRSTSTVTRARRRSHPLAVRSRFSSRVSRRSTRTPCQLPALARWEWRWSVTPLISFTRRSRT